MSMVERRYMASCPTTAPTRQLGFPGDDPSTFFPLRLTPFEKFVLWDERPRQPMTSFIELYFSLPLDLIKLTTALTTTVHRNPLLASRVVQRDGDLWWDYDPLNKPELLSLSASPPVRQGWPIPIDLRHECGIRYWYGPAEKESTFGGWKLMIQLHHACSDGVGLRRVLVDALTGYAFPCAPSAAEDCPAEDIATDVCATDVCAAGGDSADQLTSATSTGLSETELASHWERLELGLLANRFDFSNSYPGPAKQKLSTWQRIKNAHYFHFRLPVSIRGTSEPDEQIQSRVECEPVRHAILSRETSAEILNCSRQLQVGINELALTLLFQTCSRWNRQHGDTRNSHIRLLMPYDLRSRIDLRMPAANRLSFSFLGRNYQQCDDFAALLTSVQTEIKNIKESRLPLDFLDALKLSATHPRLMQWAIQRSRRMATAVLTYAGDVSRGAKFNRYMPEDNGARIVGDSRMTSTFAAPPVRENTNIALGLSVNWGQLCLSAAWNRAAMTAEQCEQFLAAYVESWTRWLSSSNSSLRNGSR